MVGTGGAPKTVGGVDFWMEGTPPRKFIVIGIINDNRPGGRVAVAMRDKRIAQNAKAHGGDAVVMTTDEREVLGSVSSGQSFTSGQASASAFGVGNMGFAQGSGTSTTTGYGFAAAVGRRIARFYVLKYL